MCEYLSVAITFVLSLTLGVSEQLSHSQGVYFGKIVVDDPTAMPLKASENFIRGKARREALAAPKPFAPYHPPPCTRTGVFFGKIEVDQGEPLKASDNYIRGKARREALAAPKPFAPYHPPAPARTVQFFEIF